VEGEGAKKEVVVKFRTDRPALELSRVSKPGARKYVGTDDIRSLLHGSTMALISTSRGILTHLEAKKEKVGGEMICTVS
jgi:small subunit ribosomal protein S8